MRRNFAQVLREGKIDLKQEYDKLFNMLYSKSFAQQTKSLYDIFNESFAHFYFRGTCLSLNEFDKRNDFHFVKNPNNFNIDYLVSFCEYLQNLTIGLESSTTLDWFGDKRQVNVPFILEQIRIVIESIGYMASSEDNVTIFVERSPAAIAVSESNQIPTNLSYKVIQYNHYSMSGNVEKKKQIIIQLAGILEPKSGELYKANAKLKDDLFFLFNNLNLRHNNIDPCNKGKYKEYVANMDKATLEDWYDRTYQMCLLAFLELEYSEQRKDIDALKATITG